MKKCLMLLIVLVFIFSWWPKVYAEYYRDDFGNPIGEEKEKPEPIACPVSKYTDNEKCSLCHQMTWNNGGKPSFGLREVKPEDNYNVPNYTLNPVWDGEKIVPHIKISDIDADRFRKNLDYIRYHPEFGKLVVIDIYSGGGGLFEAWAIISHMREYEQYGYIFETRVQGFAASAAFLIFVGGTKGHRYAHALAEFMWHEIWSFKFIAVETPSKKEHEAEIFRHLMDTIHEWLPTRGNLSKEELDALVQFKEYWVNGGQLYELGFADSLIDK